MPHAPGDVEVEPIACWWKTDRNAVNIGERFTVTLTCSVVETAAVKVVPDLNQLEPTTVALQPFEVVKGVRHEDIRTPPLRYIQYEYTTRLIGDVFFGKDVDIPAVKITYHVQSSHRRRVAGPRSDVCAAGPGDARELARAEEGGGHPRHHDRYVRRHRSAPPAVLGRARGIRGRVRLRGRAAGLALVRVIGRYRVRTPSAERALPLRAVLRGCARSAAAIGQEVARDGWTGELAGPRAGGVSHRERRRPRPSRRPGSRARRTSRRATVSWRCARACFRPKRALISTSTTSGTIARTLEDANGRRPSPRAELLLNDLQESLNTFRAARYGRNGQLDTAALDAAFEQGVSALKKLRVANLWPVRTAGAVARTAADVGGMVWSR